MTHGISLIHHLHLSTPQRTTAQRDTPSNPRTGTLAAISLDSHCTPHCTTGRHRTHEQVPLQYTALHPCMSWLPCCHCYSFVFESACCLHILLADGISLEYMPGETYRMTATRPAFDIVQASNTFLLACVHVHPVSVDLVQVHCLMIRSIILTFVLKFCNVSNVHVSKPSSGTTFHKGVKAGRRGDVG